MKESDLQTLIELGKFYFLNQKFEESIKEFKKAIEIDPLNIDAHYNAGLAFEAINKQDVARDYYEHVLSLDEKHVRAKEHIDKITGND